MRERNILPNRIHKTKLLYYIREELQKNKKNKNLEQRADRSIGNFQ